MSKCPECGADALVCVSAYDNPAEWCSNCGVIVDDLDDVSRPAIVADLRARVEELARERDALHTKLEASIKHTAAIMSGGIVGAVKGALEAVAREIEQHCRHDVCANGDEVAAIVRAAKERYK